MSTFLLNIARRGAGQRALVSSEPSQLMARREASEAHDPGWAGEVESVEIGAIPAQSSGAPHDDRAMPNAATPVESREMPATALPALTPTPITSPGPSPLGTLAPMAQRAPSATARSTPDSSPPPATAHNASRASEGAIVAPASLRISPRQAQSDEASTSAPRAAPYPVNDPRLARATPQAEPIASGRTERVIVSQPIVTAMQVPAREAGTSPPAVAFAQVLTPRAASNTASAADVGAAVVSTPANTATEESAHHELLSTSSPDADTRREPTVAVVSVVEPRHEKERAREAVPIAPSREKAAIDGLIPVAMQPPPREARGSVEIHIGTIEVQSSTAWPAQPAASVETAPPPPAFAAGFDGFASLRRYAPWPR